MRIPSFIPWMIFSCLLLVACKPRLVSPATTESLMPCLMACEAKPFTEGAGKCEGLEARLRKLCGVQFEPVWEALVQGNPNGTNMDGLWYTLFAQVENGDVRIQSTVVADAKSDQLFVGYWDSVTDQVREFAEGEGKTPPPFQAWLDDSN